MDRKETSGTGLVFVCIALLACGGEETPSKVQDAPSVPPDESYQLGAVGHEQGFIWRCVDGEHVLMRRSCGEMLGCGKWTLHRGACGAPLPEEPPSSERKPLTYGGWK